MRVGHQIASCLALSLLLVNGVGVIAADATVHTVLKNLSAPGGIAIRPGGSAESYQVFIADTGAGRIVSLVSNQPEQRRDVVTGFDAKAVKNGPFESVGPHGLLFLDNMRLIVPGLGNGGAAFIRLYELREPDTTLKANQYQQNVEPPAAEDSPDSIVGGFYALARTQANEQVPDQIVATAFGDKQTTALWKVPVRANTLGELEIFGVAAPRVDSTIAAGVTVGSHGYVIASVSSSESKSSRLVFRNPIDGMMALELTIDLPAIVGLAYSPITGNLYAASAPRDSQGQGGIFRLDDVGERGAPACKAAKIAKVDNPTALAFGPDGALWVTAIGESDTDAKRGVLMKLIGDL